MKLSNKTKHMISVSTPQINLNCTNQPSRFSNYMPHVSEVLNKELRSNSSQVETLQMRFVCSEAISNRVQTTAVTRIHMIGMHQCL
ncbi:hypothetical protein GJ496_003242 [Pomphorhynchus laevis]|nr:hypothetical protein GJ496_003242 [Pomphorhynchus laevis]